MLRGRIGLPLVKGTLAHDRGRLTNRLVVFVKALDAISHCESIYGGEYQPLSTIDVRGESLSACLLFRRNRFHPATSLASSGPLQPASQDASAHRALQSQRHTAAV